MASMVPSVHLNGTSAEELQRQFRTAAEAARFAVDMARAAAPNGRDYYTQGEHAYGDAKREHDARVDKLLTVQREFEALALAVDLAAGRRR